MPPTHSISLPLPCIDLLLVVSYSTISTDIYVCSCWSPVPIKGLSDRQGQCFNTSLLRKNVIFKRHVFSQHFHPRSWLCKMTRDSKDTEANNTGKKIITRQKHLLNYVHQIISILTFQRISIWVTIDFQPNQVFQPWLNVWGISDTGKSPMPKLYRLQTISIETISVRTYAKHKMCSVFD